MIEFKFSGSFEGFTSMKDGKVLMKFFPSGKQVQGRKPDEKPHAVPVILNCETPAVVPGQECNVSGVCGHFLREYEYKKFQETKKGQEEKTYFFANKVEPLKP